MNLHEIHPGVGSTSAQKRLGRGIGSGLGKTSGKGHKGAKARSGGGKYPGFEGGQRPLTQRIPKRGFNNKRYAVVYAIVNVCDLEDFDSGVEITPELLQAAGLINKLYDGVKILGTGELTKALTVKANKFTKQAQEKIEAAGGKVEVI